mmetsp:Transcript_123129/g.216961  ORF Transcript_123129/g.216961 Transcript_123129/m.216961 type:complete len:285 (+) Transcript_123129:2776-3630(+)
MRSDGECSTACRRCGRFTSQMLQQVCAFKEALHVSSIPKSNVSPKYWPASSVSTTSSSTLISTIPRKTKIKEVLNVPSPTISSSAWYAWTSADLASWQRTSGFTDLKMCNLQSSSSSMTGSARKPSCFFSTSALLALPCAPCVAFATAVDFRASLRKLLLPSSSLDPSTEGNPTFFASPLPLLPSSTLNPAILPMEPLGLNLTSSSIPFILATDFWYICPMTCAESLMVLLSDRRLVGPRSRPLSSETMLMDTLPLACQPYTYRQLPPKGSIGIEHVLKNSFVP